MFVYGNNQRMLLYKKYISSLQW